MAKRSGAPKIVAALCLFGTLAVRSGADRIVLAPSARIVNPSCVGATWLQSSRTPSQRAWWLSVGWPKDDLGLEVEVEGRDGRSVGRQTMSLQYSVIGEAFTNNMAPAISVGVRDVLNRMGSGMGAYLALTKTLGLSRAQERILQELRVSLGLGSGWLGGVWVGVQARLPLRSTASVEYLSRRVNASVAVPLERRLDARVYSLNGETYYGVRLHFEK